MYNAGTMMLMVCESPLHAGTGSDLDFIDSPIQREKHTQFPKIEGSSLKGALRERFRPFFTVPKTDDTKLRDGNDDGKMVTAFGPYHLNSENTAQGSLGFSDARLLLFPVKSMKGVFAWITCPQVLNRFVADMQRLPGQEGFSLMGMPDIEVGEAFNFSGNLVIRNGDKTAIVLEEFDFPNVIDLNIKVNGVRINKWLADAIYPNKADKYWNDTLQSNLVILSDTDFADFVEYSTEVITRNRINHVTGTVEDGALFTEEYLPSDSVLYSLVLAHPEFKKDSPKPAKDILKFFTDHLSGPAASTFRVGGNATIGKGVLRVSFPVVTASPTEKLKAHAQ